MLKSGLHTRDLVREEEQAYPFNETIQAHSHSQAVNQKAGLFQSLWYSTNTLMWPAHSKRLKQDSTSGPLTDHFTQ